MPAQFAGFSYIASVNAARVINNEPSQAVAPYVGAMQNSHPLRPSPRWFAPCRRSALSLLSALALATTLTGCSVVAIGLAAPVIALAIPLFALQMLVGDVERFVPAASA